jgi:hypothetical protein
MTVHRLIRGRYKASLVRLHIPTTALRQVMPEDRRVVDGLREQAVAVVGLEMAQVLDDSRAGGIRTGQLQTP